jgi:hypothetical protein
MPKITNKRGKSKVVEDEYEYEYEYEEPEPTVVPKKKKGRKPSGKLYSSVESMQENVPENTLSTNCVLTCLPLSDKDIYKITGKKQKEPPKVQIIKSNINMFEFQDDDNAELESLLTKTTKELAQLKVEHDELVEKFSRFKYLESIVSDNGVIDREYHYPKILTVDTGSGKWKSKTDIWCRWCSHGFDTVPIGLPELYDQKEQKFSVRSCFCSFNCAHAYNISLADHKVWERYALLARIKNIIFEGTTNENKRIVAAPPQEMLNVYGGPKTIEEFRSNRIFVPKKYIKLLPPIIPYFTVIEEIPVYFRTSQNTSIYDKLRSRTVKPSSLKVNATPKKKLGGVDKTIQDAFQ